MFTLGIFLVHTCEITAGTCQNIAVKCCTCSSFKTNTGVLDPLRRINRSTRSRVCPTPLFWKWRVLKCLIWQSRPLKKEVPQRWNAIDFYEQVHCLYFFSYKCINVITWIYLFPPFSFSKERQVHLMSSVHCWVTPEQKDKTSIAGKTTQRGGSCACPGGR